MESSQTKELACYKFPYLVTSVVIISFWSVWYFYIERLFDGSDEPLGIVALLTLALLIARKFKRAEIGSSQARKLYMFSGFFFLLLYIVSFYSVSKLASALLAVLALSCIVSWLIIPLKLQEFTLAILSLPVIASVNFYLGYPMRVVVAKLASTMLAFGGVMAKPVGTLLAYQDKLVYVDAPCSGVKLLWFSLFITAALSSYLDLKPLRASLYVFLAAILSLFANSLRVTSLFYIEAGLVVMPNWDTNHLHQALGLAVQAILLIGIVFSITKISPSNEDHFQSSTKEDSNKLVSKPTIICLIGLAAVIFSLPFTLNKTKEARTQKSITVAIPDFLKGLELVPEKIEERHKAFIMNFPGTIKLYRHSNQLYIIKFIEKPTRKVHPASDCYMGAGYKIEWQPIQIEKSGAKWSSFLAIKDRVRFSIKERIIDSKGNQWTDPSSWYWSAVLGETKPPWWGITVEEGGLHKIRQN